MKPVDSSDSSRATGTHGAYDGSSREGRGPSSGARARKLASASSFYKKTKRIGRLFVETATRWSDDRCYRLGASLAFYALFSVFPLLLLLVTIFGFFVGSLRDTILDYFASTGSPGVRALVDETLASMQRHETARGVGAVASAFMLIFGASGVFSELDYSMNLIWRVKPPERVGVWATIFGVVRDKAIAFALVAGAALVLLASLVVGTALSAFADSAQTYLHNPGFWQLVETGVSTAFIALVAASIFRALPQTYVAWRDVAIGALITAVLFTILKRLLAWYLAHVGSYAVYGAVGAVLGLLMWIYLMSQVLFFGAEFTRVYAEHFGSLAKLSARDRLKH